MILAVCYFGYNFFIIGVMVKDALKTSFAESGCTPIPIVLALLAALPLQAGTIFFVWILPLWFPGRFRVGGERIRAEEDSFDVMGIVAEGGGAFSYYLPRISGTIPAVIILPIFGGDDYRLERYFARYFVKRGLAAIVVQREKEEIVTDERVLNTLLYNSVLEGISVLNWVQSRPEINAERIAVFGVSMGAIRGALLAAIDQRITAAVLALVGGDLPHIIRHCQDGAWRGKGVSKKRAEYLKEKRITPAAFERRLRKHIVWDPLEFAPYADPNKILLVLAALDRVIPFMKGLQLRHAMGKPKTIILPSGHYTAMIFLPFVRYAAYRFLKQKLGT